MGRKQFILSCGLSLLIMLAISMIACPNYALAANQIELKQSSSNPCQISVSLSLEKEVSVASFQLTFQLTDTNQNIKDVTFTMDDKIKATKGVLEECEYEASTGTLHVYFVGTKELNDVKQGGVKLGTMTFLLKDTTADTKVTIGSLTTVLASLSHQSTRVVATDFGSFTLHTKSSSSPSRPSKPDDSDDDEDDSYGTGNPGVEDLEIEGYMKENKDLDQLAISLRVMSEDEDRVNQNIFALKENVVYAIDFKNGGKAIEDDVTIQLKLPLAFSTVKSNHATVSSKNKTLTWNLAGLERDEAGTIIVVIRYTSLGSSSTTYQKVTSVASISVNGRTKDRSGVVNQIVKDLDETVREEHNPYMRGDKAGTFRPDATLTRAEAAIVFARVFGISLNYDYTTRQPFSDVGELYSEAQRAISAMVYHGLMEGYTDGTFRPNQPITRGEFMTVLARQVEAEYGDGFEIKEEDELIKIYKAKTILFYTDEESSYDAHWAYIYVTLLARLNMTPATDSHRDLRLNDMITRAEVTQLVNYYLLRTPASTSSSTRSNFIDVSRTHKLYGDIIEATRESHLFEYNDELEEIAR